MIINRLSISDVALIEPQIFSDERGFFFESFNQRRFEDAIGRSVTFIQDNHSHSLHNVLRGLHFQTQNQQAKLIRVAVGEVFDVAVDLRPNSPTFGKWVGAILSAENKRQLWIPEGFAHGFLTLSPAAECLYKVTDYYAPQFEECIAWNDPELGISWPLSTAPLLSQKDSTAGTFLSFKSRILDSRTLESQILMGHSIKNREHK